MIPPNPVLRLTLDNNAIDPIADTEGLCLAIRELVDAGQLDILWTHVVIDEVLSIQDVERRHQLVITAAQIARVVNTRGVVFDVSRFDVSSFGDDGEIEGYRGAAAGDTNDALIALTTQHGAHAVVTRDKRMAAKCRDRGIRVLDPTEILDAYREAAEG